MSGEERTVGQAAGDAICWVGVATVMMVVLVVETPGDDTDLESEDAMGLTATVAIEGATSAGFGWWTGDMAVWDTCCFSLFRHLALRFWNHTYTARGGGGEAQGEDWNRVAGN